MMDHANIGVVVLDRCTQGTIVFTDLRRTSIPGPMHLRVGDVKPTRVITGHADTYRERQTSWHRL